VLPGCAYCLLTDTCGQAGSAFNAACPVPGGAMTSGSYWNGCDGFCSTAYPRFDWFVGCEGGMLGHGGRGFLGRHP